MNILLSNQSNTAIYEQIVSQMKDAIINGEILPEEPPPSIRALARGLQISVITTKRAYEEMEQEGLIYSVPGRGFYVCRQNTDFLREKKVQEIEKQMQKLIADCRRAGLSCADMTDMLEILYQEDGTQE